MGPATLWHRSSSFSDAQCIFRHISGDVSIGRPVAFIDDTSGDWYCTTFIGDNFVYHEYAPNSTEICVTRNSAIVENEGQKNVVLFLRTKTKLVEWMRSLDCIALRALQRQCFFFCSVVVLSIILPDDRFFCVYTLILIDNNH